MAEASSRQPLGNGVTVRVSKEHTFGTDTILLAHFAAVQPRETACDLGTGCLTIPLLWCRERPPRHIYAVELQPDACALARQSLEENGLQDRITLLEHDLRALRGVLPAEGCDVVSCNPPYKQQGTGLLNPQAEKSTARHELTCTVQDVCQSAGYLLRFGGRLCLCQRPERLLDVCDAMRQANLEPKRLRFVQQRPGKEPKLVLVEGRKGGRKGGLRVLPTLLVEENGAWSPEMLQIYGSYKEGYV